MSPEPDVAAELSVRSLPTDTVGLLDGLTTTRAVRRYADEAVPDEALRAMLFAATRAPSGSNRQPFRFLVLTDGPNAQAAKRLIAERGRSMWEAKRVNDGFDRGSSDDSAAPKARLDRAMRAYAAALEHVPVLILAWLLRYRAANSLEGASIYPACQNLLLAARALGYGGVMTGLHREVEPELRELFQVPPEAFLAATITIGRPKGRHGPVRRRPIGELVYEESWGASPHWAVDPPGTRHTAAGPPVA